MNLWLKTNTLIAAAAGVLALSPAVRAQAPVPPEAQETPARRDTGPTAQDQGNKKADREMTAKIRKAVVEDDSLSVSAHNVKIITRDGKVTLRGRVRSNEEKAAVAAIAQSVAGDAVDNQLTVKPPSE